VSKSFKAFLIASALVIGATSAQAASDPQDVVDSSWLTIGHLRKDPEFGVAKDLLGRAKGVMIIPNLFKGGFIFGGEGGDAVLLVRDPQNGWSSPAFYTLTAASFGLQIGAETAEVVLFLMNPGAVNSFMKDEVKLGAQAGLALVTLGSTAEAATTTNLGADVYVWSSSSGLYAGLTLDGSYVKPRDSFNAEYYGHAELPADILVKREVSNPKAAQLQQALDSAQ